MRSMFVEFPDDPTCRTLDRQYMFGPDLLVAPVFTYSGDVEYYLPAGTWTNWFTGEQVSSEHGLWRRERHGFDTLPLWVRDGSVLVTKPGAKKPDYEYGKDALVSVFLDQAMPLKRWFRRLAGRRWCSTLVVPMTALKCPAPTAAPSPHDLASATSSMRRKAKRY